MSSTVLRVVRTLSSFLSVVGSSLIIVHVMILRTRGRNNHGGGNINVSSPPKHRLLVGLSVSDLIFSLENLIFTPFLYPFTEPSPLCRFDGFLHSLGNAAAYYNASLSFYFMAIIRWNIRDADFRKRYEIFCHLLPVGVALMTAITATVLDLYNPKAEGLGCWIEDYPIGCAEEESEESTEELECRGDAQMLRWFPTLAIAFPFSIALIVMISSNVLIFRFVRTLEQRNARYSSVFTSHTPNMSSSLEPSSMQRNSTRRTSSILASSVAFFTASRRSIASSSTNVPTSQYYKRSRKIAHQSFCYIGAFFACYLPGVLFWISGFLYPPGQTNGKMFWLQVISAIFFPAQGFFNMLIYLRPQVIAWRDAVPDRGTLYAWRMAVCLKKPPPSSSRQRSRNNDNHHPLPGVGFGGITRRQNNNNNDNIGHENKSSNKNNNNNSINDDDYVTSGQNNSLTHHSSTVHSEINNEDDNHTVQALDNERTSGTMLVESFQTPINDSNTVRDDFVRELDQSEPQPIQQEHQDKRIPKQPLDAHDGNADDVEKDSLNSSQ